MNVIRFVLFLLLSLAGFPSSATYIERFSPQGAVSDLTSATAVFSGDMVRMGDTSATAPFTIDCISEGGDARWSNSRTWTWKARRSLRSGETCVFKLREDLTDLKGKPIEGDNQFKFFGIAPRPMALRPAPESVIEEDQAFIIDAGGPLKLSSIEKGLWCEADGVGHRIPVRLVKKDIRDAVVQRSYGVGEFAIVVTCAERLPAGSRMKLVWDKSIQSQNGTPTDRRQSFVYKVQEPFKATLSCERENANAPCSPLSQLTLSFNAPFDAKLLADFRLRTTAGIRVAESGTSDNGTLQSVTFSGPFPQHSEISLEIPKVIKDESGRPLSNASSFPLKIRVGRLPPLVKFAGNFGILELKEGGVLPVTLRNVESSLKTSRITLPGNHLFSEQRLTEDGDVIAAMRALEKFESQSREVELIVDGEKQKSTDYFYARELSFLANRAGVTRTDLPKPGGSNEFEVIGIPLKKPGYHIVEIESRLLGQAFLAANKPMYVRAAVLVTNMAVHLKVGKDNALVWVTALDSGKPVADADVQICNAAGRSLWRGKTDAKGRALVNSSLDDSLSDSDFLFASARLNGDYSFVRSDWNDGIEPWRFGVDTWVENDSFKIHSVVDRSLLRLGQTVSMKHIARSRSSKGFAFPNVADLPTKLVIRHNESGTEFAQPVAWDSQASATNSWKIPESAKLGVYEIMLKGDKQKVFFTGQIRISDFRLPVFRGTIQAVSARQPVASKVPLSLGLSFMDGGPAKNADVSVSATLRQRFISFKQHEDYRFNVNLDKEARKAFGLSESTPDEILILDQQKLKLDKNGAGQLVVDLMEKPREPKELYSEMNFSDPNGEIQTIRGSVMLSPAALAVGMKVVDTPSTSGKTRVQVIVVNNDGLPMPSQSVNLLAKRRVDYSHRRRIVGGFYAYENTIEYQDLGTVCKGQTDSKGVLTCDLQTTGTDFVYLLAQARDREGNVALASDSYYTSGHADAWFSAGNQDRIDVIPEKKEYKSGEIARFQVRTPFRDATALIAVEANGIIDSFVQPLSRFKPNIEFPVKADWGPNVFVSVLVVRGRLEPVKWYSFFEWGWREPVGWFKDWWNPDRPTAMVDLAKPSYRFGMTAIDVSTEAFQLRVNIAADKTNYRPREQATIKIKVALPDGRPAPAGTEVAFAAVDQALLELRPNDSWDLLEAIVQKRAYEVLTATAQSQVIGKRHFGKKAVPAGGGGGRAPTRELLDTLLQWQPRVKLDANGVATVKLTLNDSLTAFKLVGVATSGSNRFGTGSTSIRTLQDLQIISGLPPLVREGDRFQANLTLRNGTARQMTVSIRGQNGATLLEAKKLKLDPGGMAEASWSAKAASGIASQTWEFTANEEGGASQDRLRIVQQIAPSTPVTVQQSTFTRIDGKYEVPTTLPTGALPGKGGVEINLSSRLATPPAGLNRFFEEYPYSCLEQKVSISVGLHDANRWQQVVDNLPAYLDAQGLARYFPGNDQGSPTLTAYLLDLSSLSGFAIPQDSRERMMSGLRAFAEGRLKGDEWSPVDTLQVRRLNAIEALVRQGQKPTRAAAALKVDPSGLPTNALIDWYLILKNLPGLAQREQNMVVVQRELRNRLSFVGSRMVFNTERSDHWWWIMVNGDTNAFRLIEAVLDDADWKNDLPRLMQGAMERQIRGHWQTTNANAWARVTMDRFAQKFERDPVTGKTIAKLGNAKVNFDWKKLGGDVSPPITLPWPVAVSEGEQLEISHAGRGKPWATISVLAAIPGGPARNAGYRISRTITPLQEKIPGKFSRGDLWRVRLVVEADNDMTWVALTDPIPAGARILGDGDGRDSAIDAARDSSPNSDVLPTYTERTHASYRAYYAMLPRGKFSTQYTLRLNNAGSFALPPTRVEAMYAPDIFAEVPNARIVVGN